MNDEEFKIVLPGESKKEGTETDLRTYYGDIIYSNFKSKLKMLAGFTTGEICYCIGTKMQDTVDFHYFDHSNLMLQYSMAGKLMRWAGLYPCLNKGDDKNNDFYMKHYLQRTRPMLHLSIPSSKKEIQMNFSSEYGFKGTISKIKEKNI